MKKVLLAAVVSATCMGSIGSAMASDWFVGVEAGKAKNKLSIEQSGYKNGSKKLDHSDFGLRVGKYLNDNVRTYATTTTGKDDGNLKPFVGASIGANRTKIDVSSAGIKTEESFAYGAQTGVVYTTASVDLEGGYRYLKYDSTFKFGKDSQSLKLKNKDTQKVYLSAAYRY